MNLTFMKESIYTCEALVYSVYYVESTGRSKQTR
jgi:hypothetical protein